MARERALQSGVSLTPSTTEPYWACPQGLCEAIVDPPAQKVGSHWKLPDSLRALEGSGEKGGFDPADLQSAYGISASGGEAQQHYEEKQTIALVDVGYIPSAESNLIAYRSHYGLPPCTKAGGCFRQVNEQGEEGKPPEVDNEWNLETTLDIDMASAMCPHCHILLVESTHESLADLAVSANTAARLGATEISNSYGFPENQSLIEIEPPFEEKACGETSCQQLDTDYNHPGVVVTVSAGDGGYDNYLRNGTAPLFPAVASTVIAVGGTSLYRTAEGRKWSESVWWERSLGTGSGCSALRSKPTWQADSGCAHRTDNDVAAVAACATPVSIYSPHLGGWENVCGTSVSSPLVAGIEAHAGEAGGAVPTADTFYQRRSSLYDVTKGRNDTSCSPEYLCSAETQQNGYDGPIGNGTPASGSVVAAGEPPSARSEPPSAGKTLNGIVDPNGLATTYCFEYGATTSYGTCVPAGEASAGSGTTAVKVSQTPTGLSPGIYHYRLAAKNADGAGHGEDQILDTATATVTAIAPTFGWNVGGTHVKIAGSNFVGVSAVRFGSATAPSFNVLSETEIEAVSPAGSGTVDVTVVNAGGVSPTSEADRFKYNVLPPPAVTSVAPSVGPTTGHTWVTISGSYFVDVSAVKFGSTAAMSYKVRSETEILALSPTGTGTVDVAVTTPAGVSMAGEADRFTYEVVESPAGATPGWLAPVNLAENIPHFAYPEPTVAVDGHGDTVAIWADCSPGACGSPQEPVRAAFRPAGGSWEPPVSVAAAGLEASKGKVAFDQHGDAVALFVVYSYPGTGEVQKEHEAIQAAYRPAGGPWQKAVTLADYAGIGSIYYPHLAVDPQGDAIAVWQHGEVIQSAYRPAGGTWQAPVNLSEAGASSAEVISDQLGNAYAGWSFGGAAEVAYRPAGGNWQAPTQIPRGEGSPQLAVDAHGNAYALVYHAQGLAVAYRPSGGSWQSPVQVVSRDGEGGPYEGRLAIDPRGDALIVWSATENGKPEIEAASLPAGGHWRAPVVLGEETNPGDPQAAFDAGGDALAVWETATSEGQVVLQAARRPAGGGWHTPVAVSGSATKPQLASDPDGNGAVVWEDFAFAANVWSIQVAAYDAGPQLEGLSIPTSGTFGQPVSVSVSPLGVWSTLKETKWSFGDGSSASGTSVTHTYTAAGQYEVAVESEDVLGQKSRATGTIAIAGPPSITKVEPNHGPAAGGTAVTITGSALTGTTAVKFGSSNATSFDVNSETSITAVAPAGKGSNDITVTNPAGTSPTSPADQFTYGPTYSMSSVFFCLCIPTAVAADSKGHLFIADWYESRVQEYGEGGEYLGQLGSAGSGPGQYQQPEEIAVDSKGNVWVADEGNARVEEFNEAGGYVRALGSSGSGPGQFQLPSGVAVDAKGNVWVSDLTGSVQEFNEKGEYVRKFGSFGSEPAQFELPRRVAVDAKGDLWVADTFNNRVEEFNEKGEYLGQFGSKGEGPGQLSYPNDVAVDSQGNVYVSDIGNGRVEEFTEHGELLATLGSLGFGPGQLESPSGVAVNSNGNVWVSEESGLHVEKWTGVP